jgi:type I restriction enzyme S subunit
MLAKPAWGAGGFTPLHGTLLEKAIFHYHIWKIEPNERIDKRFLFYLLDAKTQEWKTAGSGMAMIHLTKAGIEKELLSVPPLPEQKKIAEILSGIDSAIAKLKWKARKLDSLQFSLTEEFAQELNGKGEPSALEENAEIRTGVAKNSNNEGDMVEMPYMRVANVQDGYLDLSEIKTISIDRGKVKRYLLHKGDVLINEGGDLDKVGRGVIWHEEIKECLHQNHVFAVRCSERLMPEFLSLYLKSSHSKNYFLGCAKQTTNLASINSTQLKSFPIPVPELSVQEKFIERITSTKDLSFAIATEISGLGAIKKAISGDLLSGRKRVSI